MRQAARLPAAAMHDVYDMLFDLMRLYLASAGRQAAAAVAAASASSQAGLAHSRCAAACGSGSSNRSNSSDRCGGGVCHCS